MRRLFDIVGFMKGHVGGGPVSRGLWARVRSVKFMPFLNVTSGGLARQDDRMSKYANTPDCEFVQERLPEMPVLASDYSSGASIVYQLESLILAQNERWRHA